VSSGSVDLGSSCFYLALQKVYGGQRESFDIPMAKKFTFVVRGDPEVKLEQVKSRAADSGIFFTGDLSGGTFLGDMSVLGLGIKGTYKMSGNNMVVNVTKKPSIYPWDLVEARLRGFVEG